MANTTGKKFGGREKGTPNKLTSELRKALKNILSEEIELIPDHFKKLDPKDRMELLIKLLPYGLPKIEAIHYSENEPNVWEW